MRERFSCLGACANERATEVARSFLVHLFCFCRNFPGPNSRFKQGTINPLMFRCSSQPNNRRRITAWLLLLVCAWMGTGGVLHHTEAEGTARVAQTKAASSLHHSAAAPNDTCAACEWTQGLQGRTLSVCRVPFPLFSLPSRPRPMLPALMARPLRSRPSRAPPISSISC